MARQDDYVRITIRIPPAVHATIEERANRHDVSINSEIIHILSESSEDTHWSIISKPMSIHALATHTIQMIDSKVALATTDTERERLQKIRQRYEWLLRESEKELLDISE
jgi:hypothetical protein